MFRIVRFEGPLVVRQNENWGITGAACAQSPNLYIPIKAREEMGTLCAHFTEQGVQDCQILGLQQVSSRGWGVFGTGAQTRVGSGC